MLVRKSDLRGKNNFGWLDAKHTFSFGHYYDPKWTNFKNLLVINEDIIAPKMGFGTHPHSDMEILTFVIKGTVAHKDSLGSMGVIKPGEIQVMSAGTGIRHSEFNGEENESTHLLQIWVLPSEKNLTPRYEQKNVFEKDEYNFLKMIASSVESLQADSEIIKLNAKALFYLGRYNQSSDVLFTTSLYSNVWIQIISGELKINDQVFSAGDGIGLDSITKFHINILSACAFLIIELGQE